MTWTCTQHGFADFAQGTFGNAGQNLYVSARGILQRIFRFDTTGNGCFDIMITNSHDYNEKPRLTVIDQCTGPHPDIRELLTDGARAAAVADLNGDGYDDLVIGADQNGHLSDLAAYVYYGGPDGLSEDRRIDLPAPGCLGVACGDFNGDGRCDIALIIENGQLRIYYQTAGGFLRNHYQDLAIDLTHIAGGDINGDGYADLYARIRNGDWVVLWGGPDGLSAREPAFVGTRTADAGFEIHPFGGGNLKYAEAARPKILTIDGQTYLLYCAWEAARLMQLGPDGKFAAAMTFPVEGVLSAAAGDIDGDGQDDLVLLSRPNADQERAIVLTGGSRGFRLESAAFLPVKTARDVIIADFNGNGCGDIAICQGRNEHQFTTESLLYPCSPAGIAAEPLRFTSHDAVDILAAGSNGRGRQLILVNHQQSSTYGHVPAYIFLGGADGYRPDRRVELPGHSPGSIIPADFNDDGYTDILLINNGEDQPFLLPPSSIYWGGPGGLDPQNSTAVPPYLSWGGQVADINRDGYLDIIFTSCNQQPELNRNVVTVLYGSAQGYSPANSQTLTIAPPEVACGLLWPVLADFNNDGWLDLCVPVSNQYETLIFWGGPQGFSLERCQKLPVERGLTARAADLNGNGWLDLIIGTRASKHKNKDQEGSILIFWGGPAGFSASRCCELPCYQVNNLTIADLNQDGCLDIFASCYFNARERDINSYIYWNDHGHFSVTNRKRIFAHSSSASLACDLNEDGYVDLIVSSHRAYGNHRAEAAIWWNGPAGFSEENRSYLPSLGPHDMVGVDVGNIRDRGNEEYYTSSIIEMPADTVLSHISWEADIPAKTWVKAQARMAETRDELNQTAFTGPDGSAATWYERGEQIRQPATGRLVQYRLALGAVNSLNTPRITAVTLTGEEEHD